MSRIPGFYKLGPEGRLAALQAEGIDPACIEQLRHRGLTLEAADLMVENVVTLFALPNAVAVNFLIDGRDRFVPMVVEEPSVVAAVSNMARLARGAGGFRTESDRSVMIGQIQLVKVADPEATIAKLEAARERLLELAGEVHPRLEAYGGGVTGLEIRRLRYEEPGETPEDMVVVHVLLDCADAMGANMINTLVEQLAPVVESITGERVGLRILSNLADQRCTTAHCQVPANAFGDNGQDVIEAIASAWRFAWADPYRAATHNKGVMNGIDAVCLATGNDWRAIEAGVHAYASRDGQYRPVTRWKVVGDMLHGTIKVPLQIGIVGGPINVHPTVQSNLAILGVTTARDLSGIVAAVGLAQNLGALKALATEGIQAGHMRMHARTIAATAGANRDEIHAVITTLCAEQDFSSDRARAIVRELREDTP